MSRPPRLARPDAGGFTLMEVLVAIAVVAIALAAVYRMHSQTLFMDERGRFDTQAALLARQKLAELETREDDQWRSDQGDFGESHPGYTWQLESETVSSDQLPADGPQLKRIRLTIRRGDDNQFALTTYRHGYE